MDDFEFPGQTPVGAQSRSLGSDIDPEVPLLSGVDPFEFHSCFECFLHRRRWGKLVFASAQAIDVHNNYITVRFSMCLDPY